METLIASDKGEDLKNIDQKMRGKLESVLHARVRVRLGYGRLLNFGVVLAASGLCVSLPLLAGGVYLRMESNGTSVWATHPTDSTYSLVIPDQSPALGSAAKSSISGPMSKRREVLRRKWMPEVQAHTHTYGIDPRLVLAVIEVESNYETNAVSPKGATGLMQLMPQTARRYGMQSVSELLDPRKNIQWGVQHLKELLDQYDGQWALALAAYNAGKGALGRDQPRIPAFDETMMYVPKVLAVVEQLRSAGWSDVTYSTGLESLPVQRRLK